MLLLCLSLTFEQFSQEKQKQNQNRARIFFIAYFLMDKQDCKAVTAVYMGAAS